MAQHKNLVVILMILNGVGGGGGSSTSGSSSSSIGVVFDAEPSIGMHTARKLHF